MIGEQVSATYRATLLRELRDGDVLGDHTFTHPDLLVSGDVRGQLQHTIAVIRALSGYTPCVFRPPYGDYDQSVMQTARSLGPGDGAVERRSERLHAAGDRRDRAARARAGAARLDHHLPRRRRPARADAGRLSERSSPRCARVAIASSRSRSCSASARRTCRASSCATASACRARSCRATRSSNAARKTARTGAMRACVAPRMRAGMLRIGAARSSRLDGIQITRP